MVLKGIFFLDLWGRVMAKVKLKVTKLSNPTAMFISLVKRGANRAPFKIIKADKEHTMIDLGNLFNRNKVEKQEKPTIVGVVFENREDKTVFCELLKKHNLRDDIPKETEDGTVIYFQTEDKEIDNFSIIKMDGELVLLVKSFSPYNLSSNSSFADKVNAGGFYVSIDSACSVLRESIYNEMSMTMNPSDAATKVKVVLDDFSGYVSGLISQLPITAFKMDKEYTDIRKAELEKAEKEEEVISNKQEESKEEEDREEEDKQVETKKDENDSIKELLSAFSSIKDSINEISAQVTAIKEDNDGIKEKVEALNNDFASLSKKNRWTVNNDTPPEDGKPNKVIKSGDGDPRSGVYDTAFLNRGANLKVKP